LSDVRRPWRGKEPAVPLQEQSRDKRAKWNPKEGAGIVDGKKRMEKNGAPAAEAAVGKKSRKREGGDRLLSICSWVGKVKACLIGKSSQQRSSRRERGKLKAGGKCWYRETKREKKRERRYSQSLGKQVHARNGGRKGEGPERRYPDGQEYRGRDWGQVPLERLGGGGKGGVIV